MKSIEELRQEQLKLAKHTLSRKAMKSSVFFKPEESKKAVEEQRNRSGSSQRCYNKSICRPRDSLSSLLHYKDSTNVYWGLASTSKSNKFNEVKLATSRARVSKEKAFTKTQELHKTKVFPVF